MPDYETMRGLDRVATHDELDEYLGRHLESAGITYSEWFNTPFSEMAELLRTEGNGLRRRVLRRQVANPDDLADLLERAESRWHEIVKERRKQSWG